MKKLICAKEIEELHKQGQLECLVDSETIVTPSARDAARNCGVTITHCCGTSDPGQSPGSRMDLSPAPAAGGIDSELIYSVLKRLMEQGKLEGIMEGLSGTPYHQERHSSGLKVVNGSTVKMDVFDTGTPGTNVHFQELVSKEESKMSAGFLEIDHSRFAWELTYEEIDYVIEGTLTVEINGTPYTAHKGDVVFVPAGSRVFWQSPDKAKVFYSTYPANWADLI